MRLHTIGFAWLTLSAGICSAQDLFAIRLTETGNPSNTGVISGNSLLNVLDDAFNTIPASVEQFRDLDTTFGVDYAGVSNAITLTKNATNTQATLRFNIGNTAITRTFSGNSQADLQNQIEDYLKSNSGDLTAFQRAINATSGVAVTDGNPNATTARMANFAYDRFGFYDDMTASITRDSEGARTAGGFQWRIGMSGGSFTSGDFSGDTGQLRSTWDYYFTERVGISGGLQLAWNSVEGASIYHGTSQLGVPIRIIVPDQKLPLLWQVTPTISSAAVGSADYVSAGLIIGGGLTNLLTLTIAERFELSMANQITVHEGEPLEFDEIEVDPGVSQQIAKNGLKATWRFSKEWYVYGGATLTNFLDDAAVDSYVTPSVGLGWRSVGGSNIQLGYFGDYADDFESHQGRLVFNIAF